MAFSGQMLIEWILLVFLIVCAILATVSKRLLTTVLIFMSYSVIMSVIWVFLESPDLAGTEAAVGAGVTTVLFFVTLKRVGALRFGDNNKLHEHGVNMRQQDISIRGENSNKLEADDYDGEEDGENEQ